MISIREVSLKAILIVITFSAEANSEPTVWGQIQTFKGVMQLDGTLLHQFSVGSSHRLDLLGIRLILQHEVETDEEGKARSVWQVRGLQTSLVPSGV